MARSITLHGWKQGAKGQGSFHFPKRDSLEPFQKSFGDGVRVILEIREDDTELVRSHRGYYFGVVIKHVATAMREVGGYMIDVDSKAILDAIHDWCKKEFLDNSIVVASSTGETVTLPPSTTRLDDGGWKDYLTKIIVFTAEIWAYVIPAKMPKYAFPTEEPIFQNYRELLSNFR